MNRISKLVSGCALMALVLVVPGSLFAQQPAGQWVRERYASYPDASTAGRVVQTINSNSVVGWRSAAAESAPHPVTRDFGVFADRFYANQNPNPPTPEFVVQGQLTRGDARDRLRLNMYAKTYQFNFVAGRTYTIDLTSGDGRSGPHNPGFFDTWLRVEDSQGNIMKQDDDGGLNLNARTVFTPTQTGTYTVVATSYASNVTGSFTLRIR